MSGEDEVELTQDADSADSTVDGETDGDAETVTSPGSDSTVDRAVDSAAASFVEVEEKLSHLGEGMQTSGQAIDVERIPAAEVPEDYPAEITTADALALVLELTEAEGQTVTIYFEWPETGTDDRLAKLLQLRDVSIDRFADLHGETILLTVEDGHYLPVLPEEAPRGTDAGVYGIYAALGINLLVLLTGLLGLGGLLASGWFVVLWLVLNLVVLPVGTYLDAWDLRTTTDWDGGPLFWATFAAVPGFNVLVAGAYLVARANARPYI